MRKNSLALLVALGAATGLLWSAMFLQRGSTIPPDFQFQSHFSRRQAETFYTEARQQLRQNYWDTIQRDLKNLKFNFAWKHWRDGEGHVEGVATNLTADVMAYVTFRNGESFWITLQAKHDRGLANAALTDSR